MYYKNLPYLTFWGMAVDRLVHDHAPSTSCVRPLAARPLARHPWLDSLTNLVC